MANRVHVVVTCSNSKRGEVVDAARVSRLPSIDAPAVRCQEWTRGLRALGPGEIAVGDLYSGDHWSVAMNLRGAAKGLEVHLWVISAGYGLLGLDDRVHAYSSSFSGGEDAVVTDQRDLPLWWDALTKITLPGVGDHPRSILALAQQDPESSLLVVASPPYLRAVQRDLHRAVGAMSDSDRAVVVSGGGRGRFPELDECMLDVDARLQERLGGAMTSFNVRVARDLLSSSRGSHLSRAKAQRRYRKIQASLEPFRYPDRTKLTDEEVVRFIQSGISKNVRASRTGLLRQLREEGKACEQSRFATLFRETVEQEG